MKWKLTRPTSDDEDFSSITPKKFCTNKKTKIADDFSEEQAKKIVEMADVKKRSPKTMVREYSKLAKDEAKIYHPIVRVPNYIVDPIRCVLLPASLMLY